MTPKQKLVTGIVAGAAVVILIIVGLLARSRNNQNTDMFARPATTTTATTTRASQSGNIVVSSPQMGQHVGNPVVVSGEARVFENVVNYRLRAADGTVLAEGHATAASPDVGQFGAFRGEMQYMSNADGQGQVEVFTLSAKDGSEIDKVIIPVTYTKTPEFVKG